MGAVRRLDHYDPSMGWQGLFIVAGFGVLLIGLGVVLQVLQVVVSYLQREKNRVTNDPWDGRTLEWLTTSPALEYTFPKIPTVTTRDAFWEMKKTGRVPKNEYEDIWLPKNTGVGVIIGLLSLALGLAVVWHIWWIAILAFIGIVVALIVKLTDDEPDYLLTAKQAAAMAAEHAARHTTKHVAKESRV